MSDAPDKATFRMVPGQLTLEEVTALLSVSRRIELDPACRQGISASRQLIEQKLRDREIIYGVNTGFGLLANTVISSHEMESLQRNLILSHAAGTGPFLPDEVVRLILLLKINSLAQGYSGVRQELIDALCVFYNHDICPAVPAKGSVGASGDLAPLAHLSLPLLGEGTVRCQGQERSGQEALAIAGLAPLKLAPREGLALINGTQVSTAIALWHLLQAQWLLGAAILTGALSLEAGFGSEIPFHPKLQEVRRQSGQVHVASLLRTYLAGSGIQQARLREGRTQDPYSLRCQPQVLGACLDTMRHVKRVLMAEANGVTDNPLVFPEINSILSGGNFHAEPVAQAADFLAIALAEVGALAERRVALLMDPHFNGGLPAFLVKESGLHSGFMMAHVTAAALASANKALAHPCSVDSLPTSANQEDHVSMATQAACRLSEIVDNVEGILAIELLAACQGIELRAPLQTSAKLTGIVRETRESVSFLLEDRVLSEDIRKARRLVMSFGQANPPF